MNDLSIVIPCYNENSDIVSKTYSELTGLGAEVIVVDDGSTMELSIPHVSYTPRAGYGYAIKEGIKVASRSLILTMDGDGQHTVSDAQKIYQAFKLAGDFDMVVGSRYGFQERLLRRFGRKFLNLLASVVSNHYLIDLNSGMRIFRRDLAIAYKQILCDTFSFTTSISMAFITDNYKVFYFPINVKERTFGKSRVKVVKDGLRTLFYILWIGLALRTRRIRKILRWLRGR